jgi:hypothetical protein
MNATQDRLLERYEQALRTIPAPGGGGCHVHLMRVANLGAIAGLDAGTIEQDIRAHIPHGGRRVPDGEIRDAVRKAIAECRTAPGHTRHISHGRSRRPAKPAAPFEGTKYLKTLLARGDGAGEVDIWELSPYRIDWEPGPLDAITLLETLYKPQEPLFIGGVYDCAVHTMESHLTRIKAGNVEPHIIPNPMDGQLHETADGGASYRCDNAVKDHRFAVVEFDDMPKADQFAFWYSVITGHLLPVAALIDSGGKSIHAWLRVDLPDRAAWDHHIRRGLYDPDTGRMAILGADRACQNPSRLSRLPGHYREEKGAWQRLLYLNPARAG